MRFQNTLVKQLFCLRRVGSFALFLILVLTSAAVLQAQTLSGNNIWTGTNTFPQINNVVYMDGTVYPFTTAGLNSAISKVESNGRGGVVVIPGGGSGSILQIPITSTVSLGNGTTYDVTLSVMGRTEFVSSITNGTAVFEAYLGSGIRCVMPTPNNCLIVAPSGTTQSTLFESAPGTANEGVVLDNVELSNAVGDGGGGTVSYALLSLGSAYDSTFRNISLHNSASTIALDMSDDPGGVAAANNDTFIGFISNTADGAGGEAIRALANKNVSIGPVSFIGVNTDFASLAPHILAASVAHTA